MVNAELQVHGLRGLRVVDASVMQLRTVGAAAGARLPPRARVDERRLGGDESSTMRVAEGSRRDRRHAGVTAADRS